MIRILTDSVHYTSRTIIHFPYDNNNTNINNSNDNNTFTDDNIIKKYQCYQ